MLMIILMKMTVEVRKSAEGRAPVAMQLVQPLQLVFFGRAQVAVPPAQLMQPSKLTELMQAVQLV